MKKKEIEDEGNSSNIYYNHKNLGKHSISNYFVIQTTRESLH